MKIGTDGVLLGAWADVASDCRIFDMGTGSGLIAIMSAQRNTDAEIVAIDIVEDAVCEARRNVANSAWRERIEVVHGDVNEWQCEQKFDHIVSNPPFFTEALQSPNEARRTARHVRVRRRFGTRGHYALRLRNRIRLYRHLGRFADVGI